MPRRDIVWVKVTKSLVKTAIIAARLILFCHRVEDITSRKNEEAKQLSLPEQTPSSSEN